MNKYRKVRYTDDGCVLFECLQCKGSFEARHAGFVYCGHCGTKWEGALVWDEDAHYERAKLRWPRKEAISKPEWQTQSRTVFGEDISQADWENEGASFRGNAKAALNWLSYKRGGGYNDDIVQYRMVLVSRSNAGSHHGA